MPRISIEDKHTYNTTPQRALNTYFPNLGTPYPIPIVNELTYPVTGTDENNRIGRKINTSSIMSEGYIYFNNELGSQTTGASVDVPFYQAFYGVPDTTVPQGFEIPGYLGRKAIASELDVVNSTSYHFNPNMDNWNISIRHFVIEFDDNSLSQLTIGAKITYFRDWYQSLVIQTSTDRYPSNSMQVLRESTPYTGTFKILYDKTHHLTPSNKVLHYSYTIPYKRTLNFDAAEERAVS